MLNTSHLINDRQSWIELIKLTLVVLLGTITVDKACVY